MPFCRVYSFLLEAPPPLPVRTCTHPDIYALVKTAGSFAKKNLHTLAKNRLRCQLLQKNRIFSATDKGIFLPKVRLVNVKLLLRKSKSRKGKFWTLRNFVLTMFYVDIRRIFAPKIFYRVFKVSDFFGRKVESNWVFGGEITPTVSRNKFLPEN